MAITHGDSRAAKSPYGLLHAPVASARNMLLTVERFVPCHVTCMAEQPILAVAMSKRFLEWLYGQGFEHRVTEVYQSEVFAQYIGSGESVVGNDRYGRITADIQRMNHAIFNLLGIPS